MDPHPCWTRWSFIYTLLSATFPSNLHIIWLDPFSDWSYFYVACVCNHRHWTNQNRRSMMRLMSHLSCDYEIFSSFWLSFSLMTSLTMMVMGLVHLVRALFYVLLKIPLVMSVEYFLLVVSVEYIVHWVTKSLVCVSVSGIFSVNQVKPPLVVTMEYFMLVVSVVYFYSVESENYLQLFKLQNWFDSQN